MALRGKWTSGRLQLYAGADSACEGLGIDFGLTDSGAVLHGAGTATTRVVTPTADKKFLSYYVENSATSGDNRGLYLRHYTSGASGGGDAARLFHTIQNVTAGTAHGAHISLDFATTGKLTGLGIAARCTLHIPNQAMSGGGNYAPLQAEIYSDGAASDPAGMTELSLIRLVNDGNAAGKADVDDDCMLFATNGFTAASGNMIGANVATTDTLTYANYKQIRVDIEGTAHYFIAAQTIGVVAT